MHSKDLLSLIFSLALFFSFLPLALPVTSFAEEITITTYYPSPYGSYNELQANKMAVGDTNGDSKLTSADLPPADGQLYTARSVIYKPQNDLAAIQSLPNPKVGEVVYSQGDDEFYYNNTGTSSGWVAQAGGTCMVTYNSAVGSCSCPSGWTLKYDLGSWGSCRAVGASFFRPPGGGCPSGWNSNNIGEGCLCCQ